MMTNLFSVFDPSADLFISNWSSTLFFILFLPSTLFLSLSRSNKILNIIVSKIFNEMKMILPSNPHLVLIAVSLFFFIACVNSAGLLSYNFTSSSHLVFTLSLALPLWLSYTSFWWSHKPSSALSHLVPSGTPPILIPFMVIIESISSIIRPFTLAVRLAANMIAGHLLLTLLGSAASIFSFSTSIVILSSSTLLILEGAVAVIQAYVFIVLTSLYISEV